MKRKICALGLVVNKNNEIMYTVESEPIFKKDNQELVGCHKSISSVETGCRETMSSSLDYLITGKTLQASTEQAPKRSQSLQLAEGGRGQRRYRKPLVGFGVQIFPAVQIGLVSVAPGIWVLSQVMLSFQLLYATELPQSLHSTLQSSRQKWSLSLSSERHE